MYYHRAQIFPRKMCFGGMHTYIRTNRHTHTHDMNRKSYSTHMEHTKILVYTFVPPVLVDIFREIRCVQEAKKLPFISQHQSIVYSRSCIHSVCCVRVWVSVCNRNGTLAWAGKQSILLNVYSKHIKLAFSSFVNIYRCIARDEKKNTTSLNASKGVLACVCACSFCCTFSPKLLPDRMLSFWIICCYFLLLSCVCVFSLFIFLRLFLFSIY